MAAVTVSRDFGARKNKSVNASTVSPSMCHAVMGLGASLIAQLVKNPPAMQETPVRFLGQMGLDAMMGFKPAFSLSSFTLFKNFFSSSLLSAIRVVSSAYLRLLIYFSRQSWFRLVIHPAQRFT